MYDTDGPVKWGFKAPCRAPAQAMHCVATRFAAPIKRSDVLVAPVVALVASTERCQFPAFSTQGFSATTIDEQKTQLALVT